MSLIRGTAWGPIRWYIQFGEKFIYFEFSSAQSHVEFVYFLFYFIGICLVIVFIFIFIITYVYLYLFFVGLSGCVVQVGF